MFKLHFRRRIAVNEIAQSFSAIDGVTDAFTNEIGKPPEEASASEILSFLRARLECARKMSPLLDAFKAENARLHSENSNLRSKHERNMEYLQRENEVLKRQNLELRSLNAELAINKTVFEKVKLAVQSDLQISEQFSKILTNQSMKLIEEQIVKNAPEENLIRMMYTAESSAVASQPQPKEPSTNDIRIAPGFWPGSMRE